jgi:hypothetical protein
MISLAVKFAASRVANIAPTEVPAKRFIFGSIPASFRARIAPQYANPHTPPPSKTRFS